MNYVSRNLGANLYITKPLTFEGLIQVIILTELDFANADDKCLHDDRKRHHNQNQVHQHKVLGKYWLEVVELPP